MAISSLCLYISTEDREIFDLGQIKLFNLKIIFSDVAKAAQGRQQLTKKNKKSVVSNSIPRLAPSINGKKLNRV
jgi:hypothetical protein